MLFLSYWLILKIEDRMVGYWHRPQRAAPASKMGWEEPFRQFHLVRPPGGDYSYFQLALLDKNNGKVKRDQHFWQKGALQTVSLGPFHQKETLATKITTRIKPKKKISSFILLTKNFPFGSSSSSVPPEGDISALLEQRKHHEKKTRSFDQQKPFRQFH